MICALTILVCSVLAYKLGHWLGVDKGYLEGSLHEERFNRVWRENLTP